MSVMCNRVPSGNSKFSFSSIEKSLLLFDCGSLYLLSYFFVS